MMSIRMHLRDVGLAHSEVPIEHAPQKSCRYSHAETLTESKQQFTEDCSTQTNQHDSLATKYVRGPTPPNTTDEISNKECTAEISSFLSYAHEHYTLSEYPTYNPHPAYMHICNCITGCRKK